MKEKHKRKFSSGYMREEHCQNIQNSNKHFSCVQLMQESCAFLQMKTQSSSTTRITFEEMYELVEFRGK